MLLWGQQVKRRKDLVPQLDRTRVKRSTFSEEANRLNRRKEEWSTRIAELEQQLQEAREHADNASGEYEKVQAQAAEVAVLGEKMEKEIRGIDVELLQQSIIAMHCSYNTDRNYCLAEVTLESLITSDSNSDRMNINERCKRSSSGQDD